ncbi:MAG: O-methyltransferase [Paludibacteraceae bacterium]|nr:O-methyltransferase [Paludibacteraceae bacterium]
MDILEYIEQHSSPESDVLQQITHSTHIEMINPRMMSGHVQGRVLSMISQMIQPSRILELGTFTGYSALCLAEGLREDGRLVSLEHNDELEDMIRRNLSLSPLGDRIDLVIGDACEWLAAQTTDQLYDLVFIDADKREYCAYLDAVLPLVRPGGWILADNTLWDGHIVEAAYDKDKQTIALRAFNDQVAQDPRLEKVILPIRDGLTIIRVKP